MVLTNFKDGEDVSAGDYVKLLAGWTEVAAELEKRFELRDRELIIWTLCPKAPKEQDDPLVLLPGVEICAQRQVCSGPKALLESPGEYGGDNLVVESRAGGFYIRLDGYSKKFGRFIGISELIDDILVQLRENRKS